MGAPALDTGAEPRGARGGGRRHAGNVERRAPRPPLRRPPLPASRRPPRPHAGAPDPGLDRREQAARTRPDRPGRRRLGQPADVLQAATRSRRGQTSRSIAPPARPAATRARSAASTTSRAPSRPRPRALPPTPTRHRRPTRALGRSADAPRARPRLRHVRARRPARPARRSPPSSRTSPRGCANASPSGEPPRSCSPHPEAARVSSRARLRGDLRRPPAGAMLYKMLLAVHAQIRRELAGVERLAAAVVDGLVCRRAQRGARGAEKQQHALAVPGQLPALLPLRPPAPSRRRHALLRRTGADQPGDQAGRRAAEGRPPRGLRPSRRGRSRRQSPERQRQPRRPPRRRRCTRRRSRNTCSPTSTTRSETSPPRLDGCATCPRHPARSPTAIPSQGGPPMSTTHTPDRFTTLPDEQTLADDRRRARGARIQRRSRR